MNPTSLFTAALDLRAPWGLADVAFDPARRLANQAGEYLRRHGPFEPHRLPLDEMEYTTMPQVMKKLEKRFLDL